MIINGIEFDIKLISKQIKKEMTKSRYSHTLGVAYTASCLAMRFCADSNTAYLAGLLHDCAKCIADEEQIQKCELYKIPISEVEKKSPYLLHAKLGTYYAEHKYNISIKEILNAITYHTTARPDMTLLEKIIFVADYIEPGRNKAKNLNAIRTLCFQNIDEGVYIILKDTIEYLNNTGCTIDEKSIDAYNYYKKLLNK